MVLGEDGTGKTGLVMDYIHKDLLIDTEAKVLVFDLDRGANPIVSKYHKEIQNRIIVLDPRKKSEYINEDNEILEDPVKIMRLVMKASVNLRNTYKDRKIKYIVLDGLSTFLSTAESQMRLDMNKDITDGILQLYWKKRKDNFFKVIDLLLTVETNIFLIGHTNFVLNEKSTGVTRDMNARVLQRIVCEREDVSDGIRLFGRVSKSKLEATKENDRKNFMVVKNKEVKFDSTKVFEDLI